MVRLPRALFPALLLGAALLGGLSACRPDTSASRDDLTAKLVFTAAGTYDAQAERRERIGGGQRRVTWERRPPLAAERVVVTYDSDVRPASWDMEIGAPRFTAQAAAGPGARAVSTPDGPGYRPAPTSRLRDVLVLRTPDGLRLLTRGYAARKEPTLLAAFR